MSEYDDLVEGYEGAPSSEGERRDDDAEVPGSTPGGPTETPAHREPTEEEAALGVTRVSDIAAMTRDAWAEAEALDEPPHDPSDWPEPAPEIPTFADIPVVVDPELPEGTLALTELRVLRPDQRPQTGQHYVVFGGVPRPVLRDGLAVTEDEFVRSQMDVDGLKDADGQRQARADRALRQRYRGYLCGEMRGL